MESTNSETELVRNSEEGTMINTETIPNPGRLDDRQLHDEQMNSTISDQEDYALDLSNNAMNISVENQHSKDEILDSIDMMDAVKSEVRANDTSNSIGESEPLCLIKPELCDETIPSSIDVQKEDNLMDLFAAAYEKVRKPAEPLSYTCVVCSKVFKGKGNLNCHMRIHTGVKAYACEICEKRFRTRTILKHHMAVHNTERSFSCEICGKKFKLKGHLTGHMSVHSDNKRYPCEKCDLTFSRKYGLKRHMINCKGKQNNFNLASDPDKFQALLTQTDVTKPYICIICGARFKTSGSLNFHIKIHTADKSFTCEICNMSFNRKATLKRHQLVHSDERPYPCHICDKTFKRQAHLDGHMLLHGQQKPFICGCGASYTEQTSLEIHLAECCNTVVKMQDLISQHEVRNDHIIDRSTIPPRDLDVLAHHKKLEMMVNHDVNNSANTSFNQQEDDELYNHQSKTSSSSSMLRVSMPKPSSRRKTNQPSSLKSKRVDDGGPANINAFYEGDDGSELDENNPIALVQATKRLLGCFKMTDSLRSLENVDNKCIVLSEDHSSKAGESETAAVHAAPDSLLHANLGNFKEENKDDVSMPVDPSKPHVCPLCGKGFKMKGNLNCHVKTHNGEKPFSCDLCPMSFNRNSTLKRHQLVHNNERPYSCPTCKKTYKQKSHLDGHVLSHRNYKPFSCKFCGKRYTKKQSLNFHIPKCVSMNGSEPVKFYARIPPDFARNNAMYEEGVIDHRSEMLKAEPEGLDENQDSFESDLSNFISDSNCDSRKANPRKLLKVVTKLKTRKRMKDTSKGQIAKLAGHIAEGLSGSCQENTLVGSINASILEIADKVINSVGNVTHTSNTVQSESQDSDCANTVPREEPMSSDETDSSGNMGFLQTDNFKSGDFVQDFSFNTPAHANTLHSDFAAKSEANFSQIEDFAQQDLFAKLYKCDVCRKSYTSKQDLKCHKLIHGGEKSFPCDSCYRTFTSKEALKNHVVVHTDERLYSCDVCEKKFKLKGHLKCHMLTHSEVKMFSCPFCERKFTRNTHLKRHVAVHVAKKKYCEICNEEFAFATDVKEHMSKVHGPRPYSCNLCQKTFKQKDSLKDHLRSHTGEKPFQCEFCHKSFTRMNVLKRHFEVHTGENHYTCEICVKHFTRKDRFKKHLKTHTETTVDSDVKSVGGKNEENFCEVEDLESTENKDFEQVQPILQNDCD